MTGPDLISVFTAHLSGLSLYQFLQSKEGETEAWRSNALCLGLAGVQEESLEKAAGLSGVQSEIGISRGFQVLFSGVLNLNCWLAMKKASFTSESVKMEMDLLGE